METDLKQLITNVRYGLQEPTPNFWSDAQILASIHAEIEDLTDEIIRTDQGYFVRTEYISTVKDQEMYDLAYDSFRILLVEDIGENKESEDSPSRIDPISRHQKTSSGYFLRNQMIGISPIPAFTYTDVLKIYYDKVPVSLHYGTASAGAATTITFPSTPTVGSLVLRDDYYNCSTIKIVSGTGAGQIREIRNFDAATRVATVDSWDTNPDDTSVYSILPEYVHKHYSSLVQYGTIIRALAEEQILDPSPFVRLYNRKLKSMMLTLERRQTQEPRSVRRTNTIDSGVFED